MPNFKIQKACKICQLCVKNKAFEDAIWNSKKFRKHDKNAQTLLQVSKDYNVTYNNLLVHVRKHQNMTLDRYNDKELAKIAKRAELKTKIQEAGVMPAAVKTNQSVAVWDNVIETALDQVKSGEIKLNANHLLKAAKDKSDFDIKKKNQDMALMEMMWHFASGEAMGSMEYDRRFIEGQTPADYNAADVVAGHLEEWQTRPGYIHNGTTGDAAPSGSDKVFEGDDF